MKTHTQKFTSNNFHNHEQQQANNSSTTMTQYLTIIRSIFLSYQFLFIDFILQMHQRVNQEFDSQVFPSNLINIIDRATVKLKSNKQQLVMLQKENHNLQNTKVMLSEVKNEKSVIEKRFNQKNDEIGILRETVKTLYADNERISGERQKLSKELVSSKEALTKMKKKVQKQQEQMNKHKNQLEKLTKIAEQRLTEYASEDKQKQKSIKKLNQQVQMLRSELTKTSNKLQQHKRANEQLLRYKSQNQGNIKLIQALKYENELLKRQNQTLINSLNQKSKRFTQQTNSIQAQYSNQCQKTLNLSLRVKQLEMTVEQQNIKLQTYEQDITLRTQKLKQKSEQLKDYDQKISNLVQRIQKMNIMSEQVIEQNQDLRKKCMILQQKLNQLRMVQQYVSKIKGDINYSKSMELGKLINALGSIREKM